MCFIVSNIHVGDGINYPLIFSFNRGSGLWELEVTIKGRAMEDLMGLLSESVPHSL